MKLIKSILSLSILFFFLNDISGQTEGFCIVDKFYSNSPSELKRPNLSEGTLPADPIYIRTVFHIIHHTPEENFSDDLIYALLDTLNMIYQGVDVDTSLVHPQHRSMIHDSQIRFCLASADPDGAPTNGITRTQLDSFSHFEIVFTFDGSIQGEPIKADSTGGKSPWDTDRYLNIWIAPIEDDNSSINYGVPKKDYFPLGSWVDGLIPGAVIDSRTIIDRSSFGLFSFAPGILAHECGHALGLGHVWGDLVDSLSFQDSINFCDSDDFMDDTPNCDVTLFCGDGQNTCIDSIGDKVDNVANIMNYGCMRMVTPDQSATLRSNLTFSPDMWMDESECNNFTSSSQVIKSSDFEIYPNPNDGHFFIHFREMGLEEVNLRLFDLRGKEVFNQEIESIGNQPISIDLGGKQAGLYFLKVETLWHSFVKKILVE